MNKNNTCKECGNEQCLFSHTNNKNSEWEERLENLVVFGRIVDGRPILMKDLDRQMLSNVKDFIRKERTQTLNRLKERVEGMKIKKPKCYCREYQFGEHNCGETSNAALNDILSIINEDLGEGK